MLTATILENSIRQHLGDANAQIRVMGDDGVHFEAEVVSSLFAGKTMLAQHRAVYAALAQDNLRMGLEIHALALRTRAA